MAIHFDDDPDRLYRIGIEIGRKRAREEIVRNLWQKGINMPKIARLLDLHLDKVKGIIAYWKKKGYKKIKLEPS